MDILWKNNGWMFSYRVAAIIVEGGRVLLQRPAKSYDYAFPGGHAAFGETNAQTLERELMEEIGATARVGELKWVAEIFFPWGDTPCHQICNYYLTTLTKTVTIPRSGAFAALDELGGERIDLVMEWVDIDRLEGLTVYPDPERVPTMMARLGEPGVEHFVYRE